MIPVAPLPTLCQFAWVQPRVAAVHLAPQDQCWVQCLAAEPGFECRTCQSDIRLVPKAPLAAPLPLTHQGGLGWREMGAVWALGEAPSSAMRHQCHMCGVRTFLQAHHGRGRAAIASHPSTHRSHRQRTPTGGAYRAPPWCRRRHGQWYGPHGPRAIRIHRKRKLTLAGLKNSRDTKARRGVPPLHSLVGRR